MKFVFGVWRWFFPTQRWGVDGHGDVYDLTDPHYGELTEAEKALIKSWGH